MLNNENESQTEGLEKLYSFVMEKLEAGVDKWTISKELVDMGMNRNDATQVVETIHAQIIKVAEEEQLTNSSILAALIGGGLAALVGGGLCGH